MKHFTATPELTVRAHSMRGMLYEGQAFSVSAKNKLGPFDILPGHANLISILLDCSINIETPTGSKQFAIDSGLIKVSDNAIDLFVDTTV